MAASLPPRPTPLGEKSPIADPPLLVLEDGRDTWEPPARAERPLPSPYPFVANETPGLLVDAENQSSIGDVLGPSSASKFRPAPSSYPLHLGVDGEREASEPTTGGSLYLTDCAEKR
jgi:hypothetical protein